MATQMGPLVFLLVLWFTAVSLAVQCTYKNTYSRVTIDCDRGCCALVINRDDYKKEDVCCSPMSASTIATIVGGVIVGIAFTVILTIGCICLFHKIAGERQNASSGPHSNQHIGVVMTSSPPAVTTNAYYAAPPQYNQVVSNNTGPANPHVNPAYDNKV
ncbi:uncharacterized protein LOC121369189 isoform X2 [Gigantopelta aegis]|uniref:uncharacterized protein LOC121369189 isoform X2 n=1 Tax=Gigantopelta aegis TaxID=1735272 RepID=UPI001B8896D9|nr:uncharacterized protein LOC121369189 isoform X2 [Gigantopelta aegis]